LKKLTNKNSKKAIKQSVKAPAKASSSKVDFALLEQLSEFMKEQKLAELKVEASSGSFHLRKFEGARPAAVVQSEDVAAPAAAPAARPASNGAASAIPTQSVQVKTVTIKSPFVGTYYRSPSPNQKPFVEVGQIVKPGDPLCIVEAMKLMNEIESDLRGRVVRILVENATPVEYGESLYEIEPL
jgi:acetyl-CoA carboxylase biotin carboxyl carrier protein